MKESEFKESNLRPTNMVRSSVISRYDSKSKSGFKVTFQENSPIVIEFRDQCGIESFEIDSQTVKDIMVDLGL